ncbi:hypothetical protein HK101_007199, partial [Irineochytrium annulatum]
MSSHHQTPTALRVDHLVARTMLSASCPPHTFPPTTSYHYAPVASHPNLSLLAAAASSSSTTSSTPSPPLGTPTTNASFHANAHAPPTHNFHSHRRQSDATLHQPQQPYATLHVLVGGVPFAVPSHQLHGFPDTLLTRHLRASSTSLSQSGETEVHLNLPNRCPELFRRVVLPFYDTSRRWRVEDVDVARNYMEQGAAEWAGGDLQEKMDRELKFYNLPTPFDADHTLTLVARSVEHRRLSSPIPTSADPQRRRSRPSSDNTSAFVLMDPEGWASRCVGLLEDRARWLEAERERCMSILGRLGDLLSGAIDNNDMDEHDDGWRKRKRGPVVARSSSSEVTEMSDDAFQGSGMSPSPGLQHRGGGGHEQAGDDAPLSPPEVHDAALAASPDIGSNSTTDLKKGEDGRYSCTTCDRSFSRKNDLKRHMGVHSAFKAFTCDRCFHKFNRKDALIRHGLNCVRRGSGGGSGGGGGAVGGMAGAAEETGQAAGAGGEG